MRRSLSALVLLLTVQTASSGAPAGALIVCIAEDGCASLEFALPGTWRCDESRCDPHAAPANTHGCRDIPVLTSAGPLRQTTSTDTTASPLLTALGPLMSLHSGMLSEVQVRGARRAGGRQPQRSVVLRC